MGSLEEQIEHDAKIGFPRGDAEDRRTNLTELLQYHRRGMLRKAFLDPDDEKKGFISEAQARKRVTLRDGRVIGNHLLGLLHHLAGVEERWIERGILGNLTVALRDDDSEFNPGPELTLALVAAKYRKQADKTDEIIQTNPLATLCTLPGYSDFTLERVVLHVVSETAQHRGHADLAREAVDGTTGE